MQAETRPRSQAREGATSAEADAIGPQARPSTTAFGRPAPPKALRPAPTNATADETAKGAGRPACKTQTQRERQGFRAPIPATHAAIVPETGAAKAPQNGTGVEIGRTAPCTKIPTTGSAEGLGSFTGLPEANAIGIAAFRSPPTPIKPPTQTKTPFAARRREPLPALARLAAASTSEKDATRTTKVESQTRSTCGNIV